MCDPACGADWSTPHVRSDRSGTHAESRMPNAVMFLVLHTTAAAAGFTSTLRAFFAPAVATRCGTGRKLWNVRGRR